MPQPMLPRNLNLLISNNRCVSIFVFLINLDQQLKAVDSSQLDHEDSRLLSKLLLDCKRSGLDLDPVSLSILQENKKKQSSLAISFAKNIGEDKTSIICSREDLNGLPDDFIDNLSKKDDKFIVTVQYPDLIPVMKLAKNEETRRRLDFANSARCEENISILKETVSLRAEHAKLLGYKNHPDFKLEVKMAKNPSNVQKFLKDLETRLMPIAKVELEKLKEMKKLDQTNLGVELTDFASWDYPYYNRMILEQDFNVNHEEIKQYFPMKTVIERTLELFENVLRIKFSQTNDYEVWHPDVQGILF